MKLAAKFFVGIFSLALCASLTAGETANPSSPGSAQPESAATQPESSAFSEPQILQAWGWIISHQKEVDHIEISDAELSPFLKGVAEGFNGNWCPYDYRTIISDVRKLAKARRAKFMQTIFDKNRGQANALFAELDKSPDVVKLPSGLRYQIIRPGSGPCPKPQQTVNVHFLGHLLDGTEFTQTGPIDLVLWPNRFNSYLYEVLQKLNKGEVIRLYISAPPTDMEVKMYGIQPGSLMIYEVELLDVKETPPDVLAVTIVPDAPEPPPDPPSGYSPQQIMEAWGWSVARSSPASGIGLGDSELSLLTKGLLAGIKGEAPPSDLKEIDPDIEKFIRDRQEKAREAFKEKQLADNAAFFNDLKKNPNVVELPSGLCYQILQPGSGPYPKAGQRISIQFSGRLLNGKVFEHTFPEDPHHVDLVDPCPSWLMPGWNEGLRKINKGGKIRLYIPPSLGYGEAGDNGAPPYSTLIYDIEIVDIQDKSPATSP
jgi:FKBP-type peptidyl-prolyl cis-trans isomerase